ncbi:hypothetical protein [Catalinimonas niigatensis]|uniref:hypothetical protein n=1 Tax=Catalinimonas niigatensis TaxID=1397264 RepID=UPI002666B77C|nr:hypothetical protein [Catalinimonas niigatensis]WPP49192.1 hypothetical protein PZB72_21220 [Catalinimonas niigatensis]
MRTFLLLLFLCQACQQPEYSIEGGWRVDSTLHYYNRFQYSEAGDEEIIYLYQADTLVISKADEEKEMRYVIEKDTLKWLDAGRTQTLSVFQILSLDSRHMILKEDLKPLYTQPNQQRYRQYYFSRED